MHFCVLASLFVLCCWYYRKHWKLLAITIITVGYVETYLKCNLNLEIKSILDAGEQQTNPCQRKLRFYHKWNIFSNPKADCEKYLQQKHQLKLPYCSPFRVFLMFCNEVLFEQIEICIDKVIQVYQRCIEQFSWPYNWLAVLLVSMMFMWFLKSHLKTY